MSEGRHHCSGPEGRGVLEAIGLARVVPVVTIDDAARGVGVVEALVRGGLPVVEITLRTPQAIASIRSAAAEVSGAIVGAGSVTSAAAVVEAIDAGAQFIVSPGLDAGVVASARDLGVAAIPGIATATELMRALALGVDVVKLFPAEAVGGTRLIDALSAVWPDVRFLPTGGISAANMAEYLALPEVLAVGGSWMVPRADMAGGDWASITDAAAAVVASIRGSS